ncbi:hypothetical protein J8M21_25615 [Pseudoalteromonas luteoviolacea]|uniref:hypothetical protein n=1 Tax=Pseudoalteromonas luteoviolacea TaxID=43657 RepID=UPI001B39F40A|nr:hypothetical protein [Pseudoalteromonas luteoviolacea]MBQ4880581.1 hypothetical protein [Pseudoalteromonas luteoviolacea]MBQ4909618.1 hypothetical protein [Pseudoalteromonas luteoviolacea]
MIEQYVNFRMVQSDLNCISESFKEQPAMASRVLLIKSSLTCLTNLLDNESKIRLVYKESRMLSNKFSEIKKGLQFCKYLRNIFAAHIDKDLLSLALQWKPELKVMLAEFGSEAEGYLISVFVLETAINSYSDENGHRFFSSEIDLVSDNYQFSNFLMELIDSSLDYLESLVIFLRDLSEVGKFQDLTMECFTEAAEVEFKIIKKGR